MTSGPHLAHYMILHRRQLRSRVNPLTKAALTPQHSRNAGKNSRFRQHFWKHVTNALKRATCLWHHYFLMTPQMQVAVPGCLRIDHVTKRAKMRNTLTVCDRKCEKRTRIWNTKRAWLSAYKKVLELLWHVFRT